MSIEKKRILLTVLTTVVMIACFSSLRYLAASKKDGVVRVGFIYEGDESTTYTMNFIEAQESIEEKFGDSVVSIPFYNVRGERIEDIYEDLLAADCDIVFACSYGFEEHMKQWAKENPDIQFCQATGDNANTGERLDNYHNYMGAIYQGRYIAGAVAGMKLKEQIDAGVIPADRAKIGYVAAFPYAEVISGYTAFFMGVRSLVPDVTMDVIYTNTWSQYSLEKKAAEQLIRGGCTVISQHSDTIGPATACEELCQEYPVFHVGYNGSMTEIAPSTSLVSCRIDWGPYEVAAVGAVLNGRDIESTVNAHTYGNDSWAGFDRNWVEILDINTSIAAEGTKELAEQLIRDLARGKIEVFSGDYTGTDPFDASDTIDLSKKPFQENKEASAPAFHYVLDDVIHVVEAE